MRLAVACYLSLSTYGTKNSKAHVRRGCDDVRADKRVASWQGGKQAQNGKREGKRNRHFIYKR